MNQEQALHLLQYGTTPVSNLLFDYYACIGLNEKEMMMLLHIYRFIEDHHPFPTPGELSERMAITDDECSSLLRTLINNGFLDMHKNEDDNQVMYETFSLEPLFRRIVEAFYRPAEDLRTEAEGEGELYQLFEQEFARPLSPMEYETISVWMDQDKYSADLIKAALHESVLSGKLNLRYIDRILFEWYKNGIRTKQEAKAHSDRFRKSTSSAGKASKEKLPDYPNINWLDEP
ncbi:DnaD domain-containing protein [Salibacterium halotolerans]|uniref:DNA replication protein n=1 Tax=Salibacterium halotolerans TaxID=1884432 RepID=A0A1I5Q9T9_9BACI|nr:DnaD domain-containing protein [Salibacterium halotolerans]SFP42800.1 DNA replication protein [Salibacterium halotolerans]